MPDAVLALNAGSSSLKFGCYELGDDFSLTLRCRGTVDGLGAAPHLIARDSSKAVIEDIVWTSAGDFDATVERLLDWVARRFGGVEPSVVGHRVVHGGAEFTDPVEVTDRVLGALDALTPLAPLHQPHSLAPVRALRTLKPDLVQVACFDTAFHRTMPSLHTRLPLPPDGPTAGLRRYGFHGLSYEFIARTLRESVPDLARARVVVAHLGSGASLCAMRDGVSVETTMSLTALDGLVMATRSGALDPGVILYLQREKRLSTGQVEDLLYHRSGLKGLSGFSGDLRELLGSPEPRAREAVASFVFSIGTHVAAMAHALQGLDGLVFTAGIGENAATLREAVCDSLGWMGVELDKARNEGGVGRISRTKSRVEVRVIPTDEEWMIAHHSAGLIARRRGRHARVMAS